MTPAEAEKKGREYGWDFEAAKRSRVGWLLPSSPGAIVMLLDHAIPGPEQTKEVRDAFIRGFETSRKTQQGLT